MKLLIIGDEKRAHTYTPALPIVQESETVIVERGLDEDSIIQKAPDADAILADAIAPVSARLIAALPHLKLIHSEGVAFNAIDCEAAQSRGIYVCNNRGVNAVSVAEQTLMLMLGLLKHVRTGDAAVRQGKQIAVKEQLMVSGIGELSGATLGLIGFGAIAREVAVRANAFGAHVLYWKRHPLTAEAEAKAQIRYRELDELLATSDFVSLHIPVTPSTEGMADTAFFRKMKPSAFLINTARGEIVDNDACRAALLSHEIAGAGFDTIAPEPVQADNPLVDLPDSIASRVLYSPHIAGVTSNMFYRAYRHIWENIELVSQGKRPDDIVNGL